MKLTAPRNRRDAMCSFAEVSRGGSPSRTVRAMCGWPFGAAVLMAVSGPVGSAHAKTVYVPITFRQDSGTRPFVTVQMRDKKFLMMVHSNADFYMMTTHENAASIGIDKAGARKGYGISSPGHVSDLGRSEVVLPALTIGSVTTTDLPLSIFSIPQDPPTDGMLGVQWLRAQRVIVDYDQSRIGLPETAADSDNEDADLIAAGYVPHKISWDASRKAYFVMADVNGRRVRLSVSTVSANIVDLRFVREAGMQLGPVIGDEFGPEGSHVPSYNLRTAITLTLDGRSVSLIRPIVFDQSAYLSHSQGTYVDAATLGTDFMLDNQAVIDFGTQTLFLRQPLKCVAVQPDRNNTRPLVRSHR